MGRLLTCAAAFAAIISANTVRAEPMAKWTATSSTSIAITGDIALIGNELVFGNGKSVQLVPVEERSGRWTTLGDTGMGAIYKLSPPSDLVLLNGNTLCGVPFTYIVLSQRSARSLAMTVFRGANPPRGFGENSCAVYFYER